MATVTVYTAERMKEIEDESIVSGYLTVDEDLVLVRRDGVEIQAGSLLGPTRALLETMNNEYVDGGLVDVNGNLILTRNGGGTIDAGSVIGPQGPTGPQGPAGADGNDAPTDHGLLTGLGDDDHPQYALKATRMGDVIAQTILGSAAASVSFSSIPQTYRTLMVLFVARTDAAVFDAEVRLRFNGETSGSQLRVIVSNAAAVVGAGSGEPAITLIPGTSSTADLMTSTQVTIPGYRSAKRKSIIALGGNARGPFTYTAAMDWNNTAAINALSLTPASGNFIAGCEFTLLGVM